MAKKVTINYAQQRKVEALLCECLTVSDDGFCRYKDDANDAFIADAATRAYGFPCNDTNVAHVRLLIYGKLRPATQTAQVGLLAELETRVARLEQKMEALGKPWPGAGASGA